MKFLINILLPYFNDDIDLSKLLIDFLNGDLEQKLKIK